MFAAETMSKVDAANPRIAAIELTGSHDLAGDNPDGLVAAVHDFLTRTEAAHNRRSAGFDSTEETAWIGAERRP